MRAFLLCLAGLAAVSACDSGLKVNRDGGQDLGQALVQDGPAGQPDAAPCQGIPQPDADCYYGSPSYTCVRGDSGWRWDFTCPEPPRDAGPDAGKDCSTIAWSLASEMDLGRGRCTAVVRLDYQSLAILSHAFVCGQGALTDEASARTSATAAAVFPYTTSAGAGKLMSAATDHDQWVFYTAPSDFGGVAAVSDDTGLATFAATIVWSGKGEILFPKFFDDTDMGAGCMAPSPLPVRGINLAGTEAQPRFDEAARVVLSTALPEATRRYGENVDVVVLLYPRTVGGFDPSTAEYIVLINSCLLI